MTRVPTHPAFREKFTSRIYRSNSADEFAPFGSDEGADLLEEWASRVSELSERSTLRQILVDGGEDPDAQWAEFAAPNRGDDLDAIIISAGFVVLRLTGQIDGEGRALVVESLLRSRRNNPLGQSQFDQMIQDLGGEVPRSPDMSDELREMVDPDVGPLPSRSRDWWISLDAMPSWDVDRNFRLPAAYKQHLSWLARNLNADQQWWQWWDAGFQTESSVLDGQIEWGKKRRPTSVKTSRERGWRWIRVMIGASLSDIAPLDRQQLAAYSLEFVQMARAHVEAILHAAMKKLDLATHPELPQTRREAAQQGG